MQRDGIVQILILIIYMRHKFFFFLKLIYLLYNVFLMFIQEKSRKEIICKMTGNKFWLLISLGTEILNDQV